MATQPSTERRLTPQEYLGRERSAATKSEYIGGDILAMAGGIPEHNAITSDVLVTLGRRLLPGGCEAYNSDQRVRVRRSGPYFYPDLSMVCGEVTFDDEDCLTGYGAERVVRIRGSLGSDFICEHEILNPKAGRLLWQQRAPLHSPPGLAPSLVCFAP